MKATTIIETTRTTVLDLYRPFNAPALSPSLYTV
jgi:hypothetical protein